MTDVDAWMRLILLRLDHILRVTNLRRKGH